MIIINNNASNYEGKVYSIKVETVMGYRRGDCLFFEEENIDISKFVQNPLILCGLDNPIGMMYCMSDTINQNEDYINMDIKLRSGYNADDYDFSTREIVSPNLKARILVCIVAIKKQ